MDTIFINGKFLSQKITGVQRYAREIVKELDSLPEAGTKYCLVCPSDYDLSFALKHIPVVVLKGRGSYLWEQFRLFSYIRRKKGFLLNLCNICPILLGRKNFSTIHDVAFIDNKKTYNWKFRFVYRFLQKENVHHSSLIFTDSAFSKNRIVSIYSVRPEKITIVYCGVRPSTHVSCPPQSGCCSRPFFFAVGSTSPNKNFSYVFQAAKLNPNIDFFVAGGTGRSFSKVDETQKLANLHLIGYVEDSKLAWYYQNCAAFLFPSFYEGFGLPPLEAVSYGCKRLILSDIPVLKEIYGDCGNYVDPYHFENSTFLNCTHQITEIEKKALFKRFDWRVSASLIDRELRDFFLSQNIK